MQIIISICQKVIYGDIFRTTIFLRTGEVTGEESIKAGEVKLLEKEKKVYALIRDNPQILRKDIIKQSG